MGQKLRTVKCSFLKSCMRQGNAAVLWNQREKRWLKLQNVIFYDNIRYHCPILVTAWCLACLLHTALLGGTSGGIYWAVTFLY